MARSSNFVMAETMDKTWKKTKGEDEEEGREGGMCV